MAIDPVDNAMLNYLNDPETEKKFKKFLRKEKRQASLPSKEELEEIKKLGRRALELWKKVVKKRAKHKCEVPECKKVKFLNAHHIESFVTNKTLRYDPENGVCLCPAHHKFGWLSAHRSFCFLYELLFVKRACSLRYLQEHYRVKGSITEEFLRSRIEALTLLSFEIGEKRKEKGRWQQNV